MRIRYRSLYWRMLPVLGDQWPDFRMPILDVCNFHGSSNTVVRQISAFAVLGCCTAAAGHTAGIEVGTAAAAFVRAAAVPYLDTSCLSLLCHGLFLLCYGLVRRRGRHIRRDHLGGIAVAVDTAEGPGTVAAEGLDIAAAVLGIVAGGLGMAVGSEVADY